MSNMNNFIGAGQFQGGVTLQRRGNIGGHRAVFVDITSGGKDELKYVSMGGQLMNPFKGHGKFFAGDLAEFRLDGAAVYILKTFEVGVTAAAADTEVSISKSGYRHIPFVGDILMKAPTSLTGTGTAATVLAVKSEKISGKEVWTLTLSAAIGALSVGDILVEAVEAGSSKKMLVSNPNCVLPADYDCFFTPADVNDADDYDGARYTLTLIFSKLAWLNRMSPLPNSVKALNTSRIVGYFTF